MSLCIISLINFHSPSHDQLSPLEGWSTLCPPPQIIREALNITKIAGQPPVLSMRGRIYKPSLNLLKCGTSAAIKFLPNYCIRCGRIKLSQHPRNPLKSEVLTISTMSNMRKHQAYARISPQIIYLVAYWYMKLRDSKSCP